MIMTLVVDLPTVLEGGTLVINDSYIPHATTQPNLILFYNDVKHEVMTVESGVKMSVIFDVCQTAELIPEVIDKYAPNVRTGVRQLQRKAIAFVANHVYFDDFILKGVDRIAYELFKREGNVTVNKVIVKNNRVFLPEIMPILELGGLKTLFTKVDTVDTEELGLDNSVNYDDDIDSIDIPIQDECRLGDVYFLRSNASGKLLYDAMDEIYLGNEGFYDKIYESVAIILKR